MSALSKLWYGKYSLIQTFWGFYIGGILGLFILQNIAVVIAGAFGFGQPVTVIGLVALLLYGFVASVGVWISAGHSVSDPIWQSRVWGIIARGIVILWGVEVTWNLMKLLGRG